MSTLVHVILSETAPGVSSEEQFGSAYSGKSLFQLCLERNASFTNRQLVVGTNDYYVRVRDYFKSTGNKNYLSIIEEDELTCVYSVAFAAFSAGAEEILLITPSNALINDDTTYKKVMEQMIQVAEDGQIGVLSLSPDQAIDQMPLLIYEHDRITAVEAFQHDKKTKAFAKSKKHVAYSGIICSKAGVYLEQLKRSAPEVFKAAQNIWTARIGQYVFVQEKMKIQQVPIEEMLLAAANKVKLVIQAASESSHYRRSNMNFAL